MNTQLSQKPSVAVHVGPRQQTVSTSSQRRAGSPLRAFKTVLASRAKTMPIVFRPIAWMREDHKRTMVRRDSDIVIEGYWRCGNHFATYAFIQSQPAPVKVAHHFHAPAQLHLAARWNVPALLLVREPIEAVASATVFLEHDDPRPLLDFYNVFHESLRTIKDRLIVSDFPTTINDFSSVIRRVNERFGRQFALYRGTDEEESQLRDSIRREHRKNMQGNPATLPLPSAAKERRKLPIIDRIMSEANSRALKQAQSLYTELMSN
jgi:hypothetical protein